MLTPSGRGYGRVAARLRALGIATLLASRARHRPLRHGPRQAEARRARQGGRGGAHRRGAGRRRRAGARLHEHGLPARHLRGAGRARGRAGGQPGHRRAQDGGGRRCACGSRTARPPGRCRSRRRSFEVIVRAPCPARTHHEFRRRRRSPCRCGERYVGRCGRRGRSSLLAPPASAGTARRAGDGRQPAGQRRSAPDLRRADAALQPQHLRQPLPLPGQPAQARAVAGAVAHRLGRRPHLGVQAAPRRQVPRRQRDRRRRRRLQLQARAGDRQGAVRRLQAGAQAGQRHGARQEHGALRARQALRPVPGGDPDRHDRQSARGEGQREQQRLGRGLARLERRGLRRLPARCRDLPPARARRPQEERRPLPRLGRQPQGAAP